MNRLQFERQSRYAHQLNILRALLSSGLLLEEEFKACESQIRDLGNPVIVSDISLYQLDLASL
jgi:hypothetical protein